MKKFAASDISGFQTLPVDQGQMVLVEYAVSSEDGYLLRRTVAPGEPVSVECCQLDDEGDLRFEPWNGRLPDTCGEWEPCRLV